TRNGVVLSLNLITQQSLVTVKDIQAYEDFVERVLRKDLNIRKFHTSVSMRTVKFTTAVNLDES
ncbi:hypothetical protein AB6D07_21650, partial [Vibrio sp. 10N.239.312.C11]